MTFLFEAIIAFGILAAVIFIAIHSWRLLWANINTEFDKAKAHFSQENAQIRQELQQLKNAPATAQAPEGYEQLKTDLNELKSLLKIAQTQLNAAEENRKDLQNKIKALENKGSTKFETYFTPAELIDFINRNPELQAILRQKLRVDALERLIMEKLPQPLNTSDLDKLQKDNVDYYWRIFRNNPEFLTQFKREIIEEIKPPKKK